ncbi:hypothetical protein NEF87_003157 [Candidatus Lokiarchaeum ossiferum]|uniref:TIGR04076 family protein n=1 Tax=Candidatus Lokiarchaeum ossiferum TaxID=2951803 RepID=A0ABY6HVH5_9ARCH|nr:hypothetical protein NEF87_003157 [Candidatus Lokiarchaeum sp. B-35]
MTHSRVKITVLKRVDPSIIFNGDVPSRPNGEKYEICTALEDGQEFIVDADNSSRCPLGFCNWAWMDLFKEYLTIRGGGDFYPWLERGTAIACCSDGIRPVSFKLERLDE